jgi:hypothetical protein
LEATEREASAVERELADLTDQLGAPDTYADAERVRTLVDRHNELRDRAETLTADHARLAAELATAEEDTAPMTAR